MEDLFQVRDVEKKTGIHSELIREYTRALEKNGYKIARTNNGIKKYKLEDMDLLQELYVEKLHNPNDIIEVANYVIKQKHSQSPTIQEDSPVVVLEQTQKFDEFMNKIEILALQNNEVIRQNQTLIESHREQDEKLEDLMHEIDKKANKRDEQLIRLIRDLQESKRQVAATKNKKWLNTVKTLFVK